jgi:hypothetical protein
VARLPQPGGDNGNWGTILNDFLLQAHQADGKLKNNSITAAAIQDGTITESQLSTVVQSKLNPASANCINVRDYGAVGDGSHDDSAAIKEAESHLTNGSYLYFPAGDYRFAQQNPAGHGAVYITGLKNVGVVFDPGARLLMDNLNSSGNGTSHGIRIVGRASHIALINPHIEWVTLPSSRSFGDGISVLGFPGDGSVPGGWTGSTGTVSYITIINPTVMKYPQAGIVFNGVSDPTVLGSKAIDGLADSLHFNACRRITVNGHHSVNCADDGLAFVTYYHASDINPYGQMDDGPFNQSTLTDWCNSGSVSGVVVQGNRSNGVRVQMAKDLSIGDVTVIDKANGLIINSAKIGPGNDWQSLASRNVSIDNVTIKGTGPALGQEAGTNSGIVIGTFLIDEEDGPEWWNFEGCRISNVNMRLHDAIWSFSVEAPDSDKTKAAGFTLENIYAKVSGYTKNHSLPTISDRPNGGFRIASLYDSTISNVELITTDYKADMYLLGASQQRTENVRDSVTYNSGVTVEDLPRHNIIVDRMVHRGPGTILIQDIGGISAGEFVSYDSDGIGITLFKVRDTKIRRLQSIMAGRGSGVGRGANVLMSYNIDVGEIIVETDDHVGSLWQAFELGGGTSTYPAAKGVRIQKLVYTSTRDDGVSDVVVQTGPDAPVDWQIDAFWRHEGESQPKWRHNRYGSHGGTASPWINGPVDFDDLVEPGVYWVAGEFLDGPSDTTYHQPADSVGVVRLNVTVANPDDDPDEPLVVMQEYISQNHPELKGQRRKHSSDGLWTNWSTTIESVQTNTIADEAVTNTKLSSSVQQSLVRADNSASFTNIAWVDGPIDFDTLTSPGVLIVAGEFLNGPATTYNQPGNSGMVKLTVTTIAPDSGGGTRTDCIQEYISVDGADHGGQRRRYDGSWSGWLKY